MNVFDDDESNDTIVRCFEPLSIMLADDLEDNMVRKFYLQINISLSEVRNL